MVDYYTGSGLKLTQTGPSRLQRLYDTLLGYQYVLERIQHNAAQTSQDLNYLLEEIQAWQKETSNEPQTTVVDVDDGDSLQGC